MSFIKLASIGLLIISFIIGSGFIKFKGIYREAKKEIKTEKLMEVGFKIPYQYVANNFWNLEYAIAPRNYEYRHGKTYGFSLVSGFYAMVWMGGVLTNVFWRSYGFDNLYNKSVEKVKGLNTIGYQWSLYKDFGILGPIVLPFIFSFLLSILYLKIRYQPNMVTLGLYAYSTYAVFFSYNGAQWESPFYLYGVLIFTLVTCFCYFPFRKQTLKVTGSL